MYDLAQKSRNAMKAKLSRLIDPTPGKVDASDYGPEETDMHADRKTGARPRNPRAYKRGGTVTGVTEGDKPKPNAGKVQRKGGHPDAAEDRALVKSMVKPECREGRASGGRTKGKTNVNVIIATGPQQPQGGMPGAMPPIGAAPMGPPPMPSPNAVIPGTSPMPGGAPPAGLPPMPRKRGGRTGAGEHTATKMGKYPIETGSGGGRARLDKKDAY